MAKRYTKISDFYDRPSVLGPLSSARLNAMNAGIDAIDTYKVDTDQIVHTTAVNDTDKIPSSAVTYGIAYNLATSYIQQKAGIATLTFVNGLATVTYSGTYGLAFAIAMDTSASVIINAAFPSNGTLYISAIRNGAAYSGSTPIAYMLVK